MPINFYYDRITKEGPVPNGIGEYFIDKRKWPFPLGKPRFEPGSEQPIVKIISSFYYTMLQNDCNIELSVYDLRGRLVENLLTGYIDAGSYEVRWNAGTSASGIYFLRMVTPKSAITRKLILMK